MKDLVIASAIKVLGLLPLTCLRALGATSGWLLYVFNTRARRITERNIEIAFPDLNPAQARAFTQESLREAGKTGFEAFAIWRKSPQWLERKVVAVEGEELLKSYLAEGRGLVVLTPHHGNWEALLNFLTNHGAACAVYQPMERLPRVDELVRVARSRTGMRMAKTTQGGVIQLFKALKRGELVMILPDQVPSPAFGGEEVSFFGHPAKTMTLINGLMERARPQVCGCYAERVPGGFKVVVVAPDERIYSEDPRQCMRGLNATVEKCVLGAPTQYQWEYKRYKSLKAPYDKVYGATYSFERTPDLSA